MRKLASADHHSTERALQYRVIEVDDRSSRREDQTLSADAIPHEAEINAGWGIIAALKASTTVDVGHEGLQLG
jgi:hypothetical protein